MGKLDGLRIGWCICASYCNLELTIETLSRVKKENKVEIVPIMTSNVFSYDTRFGSAEEICKKIEDITGNRILKTLVDVEPLGPKNMIDIIVALPCTGNTMAKLALGITDNTVLSAMKSIRRVDKPTVLAISSNDLLGLNFKNLGLLMTTKHIYFVPFKMDNAQKKPNSLASDFNLIEDTIISALDGKQLQPVLL